MTKRFTGKIAWFNRQRGFGFINRNDGKGDVFLHFKDVEDGTEKTKNTIYDNQQVSFELGKDRTGRPKAMNVKRETGDADEGKINGKNL